jgi:hypothetical protein
LCRTHLGGHFTRWGGTAVTDPARLRFLVRDVFVDGLGVGTDRLGIAVFAALAIAIVAALVVWRERTPRAARLWSVTRALLFVAPYVAWVLVGQNLREQPRHVLPLLVLVTFGLGSAVALSRRARSLRFVLGALAVFVVARTSADAVARKRIPPPGVQLLAYLRAHDGIASTAVFTGASGRFLDGTEWQPRTHAAGTLADALLALTRFDAVPDVLLVTSELTRRDETPTPLTEVAVFCRPDRLDRRTPCLHLYALNAKAVVMR